MDFQKWEILVIEVERQALIELYSMLFLFKQWKEIIFFFFSGALISHTFFFEFHISIDN